MVLGHFCPQNRLLEGLYFKSFLGTEFDDVVGEVNTSNKRKELIEFLIKYMQIHLPDFKRPKSLNILYELFQ